VLAALRSVFSPTNGNPTGVVSSLPTGQILIDASPERHAQVAAVLEAISAYEAEPAPSVTLRYWAVLGSRIGTGNSDTPQILSATLDELRRIHGDLEFRLVGNATLVTESGQNGTLRGEPLSVRQATFVQGDRLNADLAIDFTYRFVTGRSQDGNNGGANPFRTVSADDQNVELNTSMQRNEFVVVGENSIMQDTISSELNGTIFYIVHWATD
jgi:hypothetical protein